MSDFMPNETQYSKYIKCPHCKFMFIFHYYSDKHDIELECPKCKKGITYTFF